MNYLVKSGLTKQETKAFKGVCLTPQSFSYATFKEGDVVNGDEYYVNKAVEAGAKAGEVIESEATKKAKLEAELEKKAKAAAKKLKAEEDAKLKAETEAAELAKKQAELEKK